MIGYGLRWLLVPCMLQLASCATETSRPNILLITLDTTRVDALGVYGNAGGHTPNLDRLAETAVVFDRALSPMGATFPSHASLFTGLYPRRHGVRSNSDSLARSFDALAERLKDAGYETAAWVSFQSLLDRGGMRQGFDVRSAEVSGKAAGELRSGEEVTRLALRWLGRRHKRPFFAWLHYFEAHTPYPVTPWAEKQLRGYRGPLSGGAPVLKFYSLGGSIPWTPEERRAIRILYDAGVREADRLLGSVLDALDESGLDSNTIVVVVADHGQDLGEHDVVGHAFSLWAPVIRVPLILRDPRLPGPRRVSTRVGLVDLMPTLLELVGLTVPADLDGRSLAAAVRGEPLEDRVYYAEVPNRSPAKHSRDTEAVAVYHRHFKSIRQDGSFRSFDLRADPRELHPLAGEAMPSRAGSIEDIAATYYDEAASGSARALRADEEAELRALGYLR